MIHSTKETCSGFCRDQMRMRRGFEYSGPPQVDLSMFTGAGVDYEAAADLDMDRAKAWVAPRPGRHALREVPLEVEEAMIAGQLAALGVLVILALLIWAIWSMVP